VFCFIFEGSIVTFQHYFCIWRCIFEGNIVFVVPAWNKWAVIALKISLKSVTGGRWGDAQTNTF